MGMGTVGRVVDFNSPDRRMTLKHMGKRLWKTKKIVNRLFLLRKGMFSRGMWTQGTL